jgi:hypothetical protein
VKILKTVCERLERVLNNEKSKVKLKEK